MQFSAELPRRLLSAKQMMNHGIEHGSKRGELNRICSILALDGAIENFLYTVVAELGGSLKPAKQNTFFTVLTAANEATIRAAKEPLPLMGEIKALHETRNGVQHNATVPDVSAVQRSIVYCSDFLEQSFRLCFHISMDDVHLADAIGNAALKTLLIDAEVECSKKNYENSIINSVHAFALLLKMQKSGEGFGLLKLSRSQIPRMMDGLFHRGCDATAKNQLEIFLSSIALEIESIWDRISIISLGANVQEYNYFRQKSPHVGLAIDNTIHVSRTGKNYCEHDCQTIFNFVYNLVLSWENSLPEEPIAPVG